MKWRDYNFTIYKNDEGMFAFQYKRKFYTWSTKAALVMGAWATKAGWDLSYTARRHNYWELTKKEMSKYKEITPLESVLYYKQVYEDYYHTIQKIIERNL